MKHIWLLGVAVLTGCALDTTRSMAHESALPTEYVGTVAGVNLYVMHDTTRGATCWVTTYRGGISCLWDSERPAR